MTMTMRLVSITLFLGMTAGASATEWVSLRSAKARYAEREVVVQATAIEFAEPPVPVEPAEEDTPLLATPNRSALEVVPDIEVGRPIADEWGATPSASEATYFPSESLPGFGTSRESWSSETVFDVLFWERGNGTNGQPVVLDGPLGPNPGSTVFTTRGMVFETTPGVRLFHGRRDCHGDGWEVGYWGLFGMDADHRADLPDGLAVPGDLGLAVPGWQTADAIQAGYTSALNVAELNMFRSEMWCTTTCNPRNPRHHVRRKTTIDWIGGLFWAGVDETAFLRVTTDPGVPITAYRVAASSNMVGTQVGVRGRRQWQDWELEGFMKVGLGGSWLQQSTSPITTGLVPDFEYRPRRHAETMNTALLSSMNITAVRPLGEHWSLRVGYNLAWLSGLALAPNQFDFTDTASSGTGINGAGSMFLFGASLGLERHW